MSTMQSGLKGTNLFEYCENNVVNMIDNNGKIPHFGRKWYNSRLWISRYVAVLIIVVGWSISGAVAKGVQKGLCNIGKKAERELRTHAEAKMKKILLRLAIKMGKAAAKKIFVNSVKKIIRLFFLVLSWRGFTIELAIAEAIERLDGKNDNYFFA